jgi:hypothetical protein
MQHRHQDTDHFDLAQLPLHKKRPQGSLCRGLLFFFGQLVVPLLLSPSSGDNGLVLPADFATLVQEF